MTPSINVFGAAISAKTLSKFWLITRSIAFASVSNASRDPHRMADPSIQLHDLHPPALCTPRKELNAGAFLLRRNQSFRSLQ
jgi:hypothetical protein